MKHIMVDITGSLDYPHSASWKHMLASQLWLVDLYSANVTTNVALPQYKVEVLIGCKANYEIKTKISIHFRKIILYY